MDVMLAIFLVLYFLMPFAVDAPAAKKSLKTILSFFERVESQNI
jgi:hypothetical protein